MTERWQKELRKLRVIEPTVDLWKRVEARPPSGDGPPPPRQRLAAAVVAVVVFAAAGSFLVRSFEGGSEGDLGASKSVDGSRVVVTATSARGDEDAFGSITLTVDGASVTGVGGTAGTWLLGSGGDHPIGYPLQRLDRSDFVKVTTGATVEIAGDADAVEMVAHVGIDPEGAETMSIDPSTLSSLVPGYYVLRVEASWVTESTETWNSQLFPIEVLPRPNGGPVDDRLIEFRLVPGIGAILSHGGSEQVGITSEPYTVGDPYDGRAFHDVITADFPYVLQIPKHTEFRVAPDERLDGYTWWPQRPADADLGQVIPGRLGPEIFYLRIGLRDGTHFDVAFAIEVLPSSSTPDLAWNDVLDCTDVKSFESGSNVDPAGSPDRWFLRNVPGMRASDVPHPVGGRTGADETRETGWVVVRDERIAWLDYRSLAGVACVGSGIGGA